MKSSVLAMLFAFVAVTTARQMQNTNPNAIVKCTDSVRVIIDKATIDPQALKCSTDSGVKLRALMTPTGLKAEDAKKIANTESCNQWFTGVGSVRNSTIVGNKPACDFVDPKTGTAGNPSSSNTAKFKWNFQDFLRDANKIKPKASKPKPTAKPATTKKLLR
ncbi:hypothetical protein Ae201684P_004303 [Aphanomyces euteiches]|nr:hypothetical protein Ae201684P_004303 [Aphanomyces euteiches]